MSQASVLVPIITGSFVYRRLTRVFRYLYYFLLLCIGFEILASLLRIFFQNNMPGLHIFTVVEFTVISIVFADYFLPDRTVRKLIMANIGFALLLAVADACIIGGIMEANTTSRSYDAASAILYALLYFYSLFKRDTPQRLVRDPMFWFAIAVLVYFANNIVYFLFREYLLSHAKDIESFGFCVYLSLNITTHLLYAYSFRCFGKWKTE